jgi:hypothetical protein
LTLLLLLEPLLVQHEQQTEHLLLGLRSSL